MNRLALGAVTAMLTLASGAGVAAAATPPPSTTPGGGISLSALHPAADAPSYFTLKVPAGSSVHDALVVTNHDTKPVDLIVSPVDGLTGQTSGSVYANRQDPVHKAGAWVKASISTLELASGASREVDFTVDVPADATAGDHLAGIAVENTQPTSSSNGFAIKQILRNVMGVLVVVPGPASFHPKLISLGVSGIGSTGIGAVDVGLGNDGEALAKPKLSVVLTGPAGYHRTLSRELDTVLPADTITYPFAWPDRLAKGSYDITASLTGGGTTVTMHRGFALGAALAGVSQPLPKIVTVVRNSGLPLWVLLLAVGGGMALLALIVGALLRRGRQRALLGRTE